MNYFEIVTVKIHLSSAEETQVLHLKWHLDAFTHLVHICLMKLRDGMNAFTLQHCKCINYVVR